MGLRPGPVPGAAVLRLVHGARRRRPGRRFLRHDLRLHGRRLHRQRAPAQLAVGPAPGRHARQPAERHRHD
ncbi:hypothetical protein G6F24_017561 [Rhizopus arrhizus]|nr:hypothetical protein G6F24_017561 [Rhizopus arrhizus]